MSVLASSNFAGPWTKLHFENNLGQQATILTSENADHLLSVTFQDHAGHQFSIPQACLVDIYSPELNTTELLNSVGMQEVSGKLVRSSSLELRMKFGAIKPGDDYGIDPKDMPIVEFITEDGVLTERVITQEKNGEYQYASVQVLDLTKPTSPDKCGVESKSGSK